MLGQLSRRRTWFFAAAMAVAGTALLTASVATADGVCWAINKYDKYNGKCLMVPTGTSPSTLGCSQYCGAGTTLANCVAAGLASINHCTNVGPTPTPPPVSACCTRVGIDQIDVIKTECQTRGGTWWQSALCTSPTDTRPMSCGEVQVRNLALAANGGVATASSQASAAFPAAAANNGDRKAVNSGNGGNWQSASVAFPHWLTVSFGASRRIGEINVFTLQDNYTAGLEPTPTMTFTQYGITAFVVEYWNGTAWVAAFSIPANNKVWQKFVFATPICTSQIRVTVTNSASGGVARIVEVEAWGM